MKRLYMRALLLVLPIALFARPGGINHCDRVRASDGDAVSVAGCEHQ